MNTVAHLIVASAVLSRREAPRRNLVICLGALLPDLSIYTFFAWSRFQGWSGDETWNVHYWTEPWQTYGAVSNSFILAGIVLAIALWRKWPLVAVGCAAVLLHLALDFPLHADDAHRHFWPTTDWRFVSPVSYWNPQANGLIGASLETLTVLVSVAAIWMRFRRIWVRGLMAVIASLQVCLLAAHIIF